MTRFTAVLMAAVAASFGQPLPLFAQGTALLKGLEGKKVRLTAAVTEEDRAGAIAIQGTVFEIRGDSIHVLQDGGQATHVAWKGVRTMHVYAGRDHVRGAQKGAIGGAIFGLLMTALGGPDCDGEGYGYDCRADGSKPTFAEYAAENMSALAVLGAIYGAIRGTDRWNPVIIQQQRVTIAPTRGGGIRVGLSFQD